MTTALQTETPQQKIHKILSSLLIPSKEIRVYGSQIMITAWSFDAAKRWANVLTQMKPSRIRTYQGIDDCKVNLKTNLNPSCVKVWRV